MKSNLLIFAAFWLMFCLINNSATAQVKTGKTVVPEKMENTIQVKPAVKKMQPVLADDPWKKSKSETYTAGTQENNEIQTEATKGNLNESSTQENNTEIKKPKDSRKSTRVKIAGSKESSVPSGK